MKSQIVKMRTKPILNIDTAILIVRKNCICKRYKKNITSHIINACKRSQTRMKRWNKWMNEWMNEWMKSYIAHVSSRRLFRALNIESNLARPVIIQIPTQSPGWYTAELPLRRIKLFSFQANSPYVPSTHTLWIFWGLAGWKLRLRPLRFFYVQL